jgi:hypothetical protein
MNVVKEYINFNRGLEPKQAMDLGLKQRWLSIKKDDILTIKKDFTTNYHNHIDDDSKYNNFKKGDFFEVNTGPNAYSDGTIGFTGYLSDNIVRSSDDIFIWGTPLELDQRLEILQGLRESQNFERGLTPNKSMGIGQSHLDKEFIDETPWEIDFDDDQIVDFIKNWNDWPILVINQEEGFIATSVNGIISSYSPTPEIAIAKVKAKIGWYMEKNSTEKAYESIHFERGMEPKKAMKIGKNFLPYKKGDYVKVWISPEKKFVEVRVYEDEELDSDGRPRIRKMISNTKPAWAVRRIWIRYNGEVKTANLAIDPIFPEEEMWILNI